MIICILHGTRTCINGNLSADGWGAKGKYQNKYDETKDIISIISNKCGLVQIPII
jgi:hypothetical protein